MKNKRDQEQPAELIGRYQNPVDCLTAYLMLESSEVLAGVKPANLLSLVNRRRPCGRNLYHLWQNLHQQVQNRLSSLEFRVLVTKENALLLLSFNREHLDQHLRHTGIRTLLHKNGYSRTACLDRLLDELQGRVQNQDRFPHEIGLFIGYPPKDVAAFMGLVALPFTSQALWKIYGNPAESLHLAANYRHCRQCMSRFLSTAKQPLQNHVQHATFLLQ